MTKTELLGLISSHACTIKAILDDNLVGGGLETEIHAALENLRDKINNEYVDDDTDYETELELELHSLSMVQRSKLEAFIKAEIYPYYNQQKSSLLL